MEKFHVTWWVTFFDHDPEIHYTVKEEFKAESLDNLFDILDEHQTVKLKFPLNFSYGISYETVFSEASI